MKRALVTGGGAGLGRAIVSHLLDQGREVVSIDRSKQAGGNNLIPIECDLADREAVDGALPAIVAAGPYDAVFFNAGVSATGCFEDIPPDAYRKLLTVNAETPMLMAAALVNADAVKGGMCFVSSLSYFTGYPGAAVYAASKDALAVYAASVRKPFARHGVSVTVAFPGPLRTDHAERHAPEGADASARQAPDIAAKRIVAATLRHQRTVFPDRKSRAIAIAGRLAPARVTRQMRRIIFDRLTRAVW